MEKEKQQNITVNNKSEFSSPYDDLNNLFAKRLELLDRTDSADNKTLLQVLRDLNKEIFNLAVRDRDLNNLLELSAVIHKQKTQLEASIKTKKAKLEDAMKGLSK